MGTIIIGVSGKKQSGKTLLCRNLYTEYAGGRFTKIYSFADTLKQKVCMDIMGLTYEQCYTTDEEKNSFTTYKWNKLPDEIRETQTIKDVPYLRHGYMTAREILQIVGTDIFRKYFDDNIWVNATLREIEKDNIDLALIADARFPSEIDSIIDNGGYVIRLLRDVCEEDTHLSETALDNYDFEKLGGKVCIVDNQKMSIEEKNNVVFNYINKVILDVK